MNGIAEENLKMGDQCYRGQVLAEVADVSAPQARLFVLEREAGNVAPGEKTIIEFDALPGKRFEGELTSVAALPRPLERNSPLRYFTCEAAISGTAKDLESIRPGMALNAEIVLDRYGSCFVVPGSAVTKKAPPTLFTCNEMTISLLSRWM
jgi:HlyD family secretion protein